jgi:predicted RNA polymerase sigma factor
VTATDTHRTIDAVGRIESARLIAGLTSIVRDVGLAEELAQDALITPNETVQTIEFPEAIKSFEVDRNLYIDAEKTEASRP